MAGKVSRENLGGWLLKCNPKVYDVVGARAAGEEIDSWSVSDNYRTELMEPGDRIILWMTGSEGAKPQPGIWAVGHVVGIPEWSVGIAADEEDANFWIDVDKGLTIQQFAPVSLDFLDVPVPRSSVQSVDALGSMEVFTQSQMSNPVYISTSEMASLEKLIGDWPEYQGESDSQITIGEAGAGFGDPLTNAVVELAAMGVVATHYEAKGWKVDDVSLDKVGWDLTCTNHGGQVHRVEVKGVSGKKPQCLLTRNEVAKASTEEGWHLAIVTAALSDKPQVRVFPAAVALPHVTPFMFQFAEK